MYAPPLQASNLGTVPTDLLGRIVLEAISTSRPPELCELTTLRSLLLTSRTIHDRLSLANNPEIYANFMCRLFEIKPVKQRMGAGAVTTSSLASELKPRIEALKALKSVLHPACNELGSLDIDPKQLIRLFLMMTENDGMNIRQFLDFVDIHRLPGFLCSYMSTRGSILDEVARNPHFTILIMLMRMCFDHGASSFDEDLELRNKVLNLLQPLVLLTSSGLDPMLHEPHTVTTFEYFGIPCNFTLPSVISFARLCTVDRYNVMRRRMCYVSDSKKNIALFSGRFDLDYARCMTTISSSPPVENGISVLCLGIMAGIWDGAWFIPCRIAPTTSTVMCTRPMRCHLREYVLLRSDLSPSLLDQPIAYAVERAWFPDGTIFEEHATSLKIYDPNHAGWVQYQPRTVSLDTSEIVDIIVVGNVSMRLLSGLKASYEIPIGVTSKSESVPETIYDEFSFHGRVRCDDGQVVIIKTPVDPSQGDLGTWAFIGNVHGSIDLVGEWRAVSNEKHPSGRGWFHLAKVEGLFQ